MRNQVRPLWLSMRTRRADVLIGNPPWVSYRYMTASMQERFRQFSQDRGLWHGKKLAARILWGCSSFRAVEKYLNNGGTFAFVTPLAVLSRQSYHGFRSGKWGSVLRAPHRLWDLDKVRPKNDLFPVPAAVIFGQRGSATLAPSNQRLFTAPATKVVVSGLRSHSGWEATSKALTFCALSPQSTDC